MIDHTGLQVSHPAKSRHFYETALKCIGYQALIVVPPEHTGGAVVVGYGVAPKADFWLAEGTPNTPRIHIAFRADNRQQVDEFYRLAMSAGGQDNGKPGLRPHYHPNYYGAFVLDPDGHNIEVVYHLPG